MTAKPRRKRSPRSDKNDTRLARHPRVTLCHVTGPLLVPGEDEVEVLRVVDRVKDGKDGSLHKRCAWTEREE
jgi:hypothetical protein